MKNKMLERMLERKPVTPAKAIEILARNGIKVNEHQAKVILDFLEILARSAIKRYFNKEAELDVQNIEPSPKNHIPTNKTDNQNVTKKIN